MTIVNCPHCNNRLEEDRRYVGREVTCPDCGGRFVMPEHLTGGSDTPVARRAGMPGKLFAVQIMMIVGGAVAVMAGLGLIASLIGIIWPGTYYSLILGCWALYRGATLPQRTSAPRGTAVAQILNVVVLDFINVGLGIVELVLLADPECEEYFESRARRERF